MRIRRDRIPIFLMPSAVWCMLKVSLPRRKTMLPSVSIHAHVEETTDPGLKLILARQILQNAGFAGFFEGYNPFTITDEELARKIEDLPLLRFHPLGLGNGPSDAGGWAWIWTFVITAILIIWLVR